MAIDLIKIKSFPSTQNLPTVKLVSIIKLCNLLRVSSPSNVNGNDTLNVEFQIDFNSLKSYHGYDIRKASKSIADTISSVNGVSDINIDLNRNFVSLKLTV